MAAITLGGNPINTAVESNIKSRFFYEFSIKIL